MTGTPVLKEQGFECYDWYHYLWHLIAIRAVKVDETGGTPLPDLDGKYRLTADAWDLVPDVPGDGEIVALIDTGVNDRHPNLAPRVLPAVDFGANPFGVAHTGGAGALEPLPTPAVEVATTMTRGLERQRTASLVSNNTWTWIKGRPAVAADPAAVAMLERLEAGRGMDLSVTQVSRQRYSAHGTACAGLIMGAPAEIGAGGCDVCGVPFDEDGGPLPYWGVAPGAHLLPITVSVQPTAEQLILAFLYARSFRQPAVPPDPAEPAGRGVSAIHFPREAPDPFRAPRHKKGYNDTTRYTAPGSKAAWDLFRIVFEEVSKEIPVVCATGNDSLDRIIYPANLASDPTNGVIAVGAVTYKATRSAYSNYADTGEAVDIVAPSDDAEVYTRHQLRFDKEAAAWRDHNHLVHLSEVPEVEYAPQAVLAPDIPGPRGYADGSLAGAQSGSRLDEDRAALYALFGGTSAASAIVAGAVALRQAKARAAGLAPLDGPAMKTQVAAAGVASVSWPWLAATPTSLAPDRPNGDGGTAAALRTRQFGAGLLDLSVLLA
jgi:hypothetical protein